MPNVWFIAAYLIVHFNALISINTEYVSPVLSEMDSAFWVMAQEIAGMSVSKYGSGLVEVVCFVFVQEQTQATLVHLTAPGERGRLPGKAGQPLTQNIVEALHTTRRPIAFACGLMLIGRQPLQKKQGRVSPPLGCKSC